MLRNAPQDAVKGLAPTPINLETAVLSAGIMHCHDRRLDVTAMRGLPRQGRRRYHFAKPRVRRQRHTGRME
jgi:hypothetical protein